MVHEISLVMQLKGDTSITHTLPVFYINHSYLFFDISVLVRVRQSLEVIVIRSSRQLGYGEEYIEFMRSEFQRAGGLNGGLNNVALPERSQKGNGQ